MEGLVTKCQPFNPQNMMVMPWQRPSPFKPLKMQDCAAFKQSLLEHNASLDIDSPKSPALLSKIIATVGPSLMEQDEFNNMIKSGMVIVRVDMARGEAQDNINTIKALKQHVINYCGTANRIVPIGIAAELKGAQILTGAMTDKNVALEEGDIINLTVHQGFDDKGTKNKVFVDHKDLPFVVKANDKILLDYGRITLNVRGCFDNDVVCEVLSGGNLKSHTTVTILDVPLNLPHLTPKDMTDLKFLVSESIDIIIVSHVMSGKCIDLIRKHIGYKGADVKIIAKVENKVGFRNFEEILREADGVIINRGRLSIEFSTEKVMQAQKMMVAKANQAGKPIWGECEYLNSMILQNCPTFAEATDVINTIIEGMDGLVLGDETSLGKNPAMTVRTMSTLMREAEAQIWQKELWSSISALAEPPTDPALAVVVGAIEAANKAHAAAIIVTTTSGTSAKILARFRPKVPIIAITRFGGVARKLQIYRSVLPIHYIVPPNSNWALDVDLRLQYGVNIGKLEGLIKPGDPLVLLSGWRQGAGFTNNIRVVYASLEEPWILPYAPVVAP